MKNGEIPALKKALIKWTENHRLNMFDFSSIIFTPMFTLDDIFRGLRRLPALYRIHLFTGLDEFKLTYNEMEIYKEDKREKTKNDEKIARHFIELYKNNNKLPEGDERLVRAERNNPDKAKVTQIILGRHFGNVKKAETKLPRSLEKKTLSTLPVPATMSIVSHAADELESVLILSAEEINSFRKGKATSLKRLKVLVDIFFKEDPKKSYEEMIKTNNSFLNF